MDMHFTDPKEELFEYMSREAYWYLERNLTGLESQMIRDWVAQNYIRTIGDGYMSSWTVGAMVRCLFQFHRYGL